MCHTSDICVLCMVTSVTWSWPWTELNIKHLLNQCLALYFRSTRGKFWPKTDNFEVSTARNLKAPILTFDLTLTWHVTSFGKFRGCFKIVSSRAFERRIVRLSAAIRSRVMTWGRLTPPPPPPPSKSRVAKYPSKCRVKENSSHSTCLYFTEIAILYLVLKIKSIKLFLPENIPPSRSFWLFQRKAVHAEETWFRRNE